MIFTQLDSPGLKGDAEDAKVDEDEMVGIDNAVVRQGLAQGIAANAQIFCYF